MLDSHQIRLARHEDLLSIERIERESNPEPWTKQALATSLDLPNQCYVLCVSDTVKAYLVGMTTAEEASLLHIVVEKTSQGQGLATRLILFWLEQLQGLQSINECWLEVRQSNFVAQAVYKKLGFKQISIRKGYYKKSRLVGDATGNATKEDALIYRLQLNAL